MVNYSYYEVNIMTNETRVGYATIDVLARETQKYIEVHTVYYKYVGKVEYLIKYQELRKYLNGG